MSRTRKGELIGGGFWIFRRNDKTGRIYPAHWPYEHATREDASTQAAALAAKHPGVKFVVVGEIEAHHENVPSAIDTEQVVPAEHSADQSAVDASLTAA